MMIATKLQSLSIAIILLCASASFGQRTTETSVPLGDKLKKALEGAALTGPHAVPFHIKVHISESTNANSTYRAEIEESWASPKQWSRVIETPDFKQILVVNGDKSSEQITGDYYPLWLRAFVNGLFDPIQNAEVWRKQDSNVTQTTLLNGQHTDACARMKFKLGSEKVNNDAFASICFDDASHLKVIASPGYGMEFHDYQKFGEKTIARRYQYDPEPGTNLVAKVLSLEELKPDASLFAIEHAIPAGQMLQSIHVTQATIEQVSDSEPALVWPAVKSGKTSGLLSMYISVDRQGRVREAYPLNADNTGLQDFARDQLLKWKLKAMAVKGVPVQAESGMTFRFDTKLAGNGAPASPDGVGGR
ncbi:MAG TPA: hypothetical protein VIX37_06725 [Candidatus Sulfotelmatobacter sp.]